MASITRVAIHSQINRQAARAREQNQAAPRPARVRFAVATTGIGESRLTGKSAIAFGAYMLDEPTFSFGIVSVSPLKLGELPQATATVLAWKKTKAGLYYGAELGLSVQSLLYHIRLKFTLTFEGSTLRTTSGTVAAAPAVAVKNVYRGGIDE